MLVATYLHQCKVLSDELAAASKTLDTELFNAIIFNNIGPEYLEVVAAFSIKG